MADDTKQPGSPEPPESDAKPTDASGTPPSSSIPPAGTLAGADAEKSAMVEQAKARVAAVKDSLTSAASQAAGTPKAPVKKKDEVPKPTDASSHPLVKKLKATFDSAIGDATEFIGQLSVTIAAESSVKICEFLKSESGGSFDYLSDLTCVHFPDRTETPFEVVYNLFSIGNNERVRLKVRVSDAIDSVVSVWPSANWLEREVFDLFGVHFANHPDMRRLLLPPDWEGHPMRKDYPLEFVENNWTANHLPEMTDVQREQLEQRRGYGLELLSIPQERLMRDIFRGGKEVMTKDK